MHKCDLCRKGFLSMTSLNHHRKYYCGRAPQFKCPHCPYKSKLNGNLKAHIASRHLDTSAMFRYNKLVN